MRQHILTDIGTKIPTRKPKTRKEMIDYLENHFRYDTMNGWNRATSYARCVKFRNINFPDRNTEDRAYEMLELEETFDDVNYFLNEFAERHNYQYQIGFNGRSGGYLVLYQGGRKDSGHKSYCPSCGQRNFKRVPPVVDPSDKEKVLRLYVASNNQWVPHGYLTQEAVIALGLPEEKVLEIVKDEKLQIQRDKSEFANISATDKCGVCGKPRRNYDRIVYQTFTQPGLGFDMEADFEDWDTYQLKNRVDLVWDFDKTVEQAVKAFVDFCSDNEVEEETIMVPRVVKVARQREAA